MGLTKKIDLFGKPIRLNFDKKEDTHKTVFGGIMTMVLVLFLIYYLYDRTQIMYSHEATFSSLVTPKDPKNIGEISIIDDAKMVFFV